MKKMLKILKWILIIISVAVVALVIKVIRDQKLQAEDQQIMIKTDEELVGEHFYLEREDKEDIDLNLYLMDYCRTELIGEVPLRSAFDTKYRFPLWFWNVAGRMQWLFGCKRQPESRNGTKERALRFVHELTLRDDDCAIVTHGFFMHTLIRVMKKQGFTEGKNMLHYDNGEAVIFYGI